MRSSIVFLLFSSLCFGLTASEMQSFVTSSSLDTAYRTIAVLQANPSLYQGQVVRIEGVITIGAGLISTAQLKAYIQDTSGAGLLLYRGSTSASDAQLVRGVKISVVGTIDNYFGNLELVNPSWTIISSGNPLPPALSAFSVSNPADYDGTWMSVGGRVSRVSTYSTATNIYVSRGSTELTVRVWNTTGINVSGISNGDSVVIYGAGSVYSSAFQLLPAYQSDIIVSSDTTSPTITPIANIQANPSAFGNVIIRGVVTAGAGKLRNDQLKIYVQDASGMGIQIFDYTMTAEQESLLSRGAYAQVSGSVTEYYGTTEIILSTWSLLGSDTMPAPKNVLDIWSNAIAWEGTWMTVTGSIVDIYTTGSGNWNLTIDANDILVPVRIWGSTGIDGANLKLGDYVRVNGVGGVYNNAFQLVPADVADVSVITFPPGQPTDKPELNVPEGVFVPSLGERMSISFSVPRGNRAILKIYDRTGFCVATLYDSYPYAPVTKSWNGRDETNSIVPAGVYLLNLESVGISGKRESARATIAIGSQMK